MWAGVLWWWDRRYLRLPNVVVYPGVVALWGMGLVGGSLGQLVMGLVWPGLYLLVWAFYKGVGGGDIKLACGLGVLVAQQGVGVVVWVVLLAQVTTVAEAVWCRRRRVAHGPHMLAAAVCGVIFG
ncbi:hypothetical protein CAQU_06960 [Corynebacterium aquilae DSM 44791]|uniref:Prepilin type IV endopeptidase peptidase domain-containing protein n=1 Tax=Corynebacterium aquilae DSM 44791 TaxID=1431546 RepID=A0A1L7CGF3_9CORY|nr:hypothetical protein CAQU_06960 [Corynebacterium aquilae DSM 44791]